MPDDKVGDQFITTSTVPVAVDELVTYSCSNPDHVTSVGKEVKLTCTKSGEFDIPSPAPSCREKTECENSPVIYDTATMLLNSSNTKAVLEYEQAVYPCKPGTALPDTVNGTLRVR